MNFSQLHERLRLELLGRIERGVITASLLARKTGLQQPHISNFLRNKRRLSLPALDSVLAALGISAAELLPAPEKATRSLALGVPIVPQQVAMNDDFVRDVSISGFVFLPPGAPAYLRSDATKRRMGRERFVAVGLTPAQAKPMEPHLQANSIVILDRHANLPAPSPTALPNIYAVRLHGQMHFCYLTLDHSFFILRPHSLAFPVELLPIPPSVAPSDLVIGRVCLSIAYF